MCNIVYDIVRKKLFMSHKISLVNIEILSCSISPGSISRITNEPIGESQRGEMLTRVKLWVAQANEKKNYNIYMHK